MPTRLEQDETKKRKSLCKRIFFYLGILFLVSSVIFVLLLVHMEWGLGSLIRFLPSDEKMIANFQKNRADFEKLVKIYSGELSVPAMERKAIMKRINVSYMMCDQTVWLPPDPYSYAAKPRMDLRARAAGCEPETRRFNGVRFGYAHKPVRRLNVDLSPVYKGYYYTPCIPKVENGELVIPYGGKEGAEYVSQTLDRYPPNLKSFDCVYRQIEPQWFLELCQEWDN